MKTICCGDPAKQDVRDLDELIFADDDNFYISTR